MINKILAFISSITLMYCSDFDTKLSNYMEKEMPLCADTTYWRVVDLQDVVGVKYDRLCIVYGFEEDIAKETESDWHGGGFCDDNKDLVLLIKDNKVVYKSTISKYDNGISAFDLPPHNYSSCKMQDTTTIYYIRIDRVSGQTYYTLYNKDRVDKGNAFFEQRIWLKNYKATPWGGEYKSHKE